jgi:CHAT domain-containing protein
MVKILALQQMRERLRSLKKYLLKPSENQKLKKTTMKNTTNRYTKTILAFIASTLLFSCTKEEKKEESKTTPTPPKTEKTYWTINGRKLSPTQIKQDDHSITCSLYEGTNLYAQWYINFDKPIWSGSYTIGGLSEQKQAYLFAEIVSPKVDSVYDSRAYETKTVEVSYTADAKLKIEVPEIWLTNRLIAGDSCLFTGVFEEQ